MCSPSPACCRRASARPPPGRWSSTRTPASAATLASSPASRKTTCRSIGPDEIGAGRDMHWLRIDAYDHGGPTRPAAGFQPVPCMHCEDAPCEPVCPVEASVHDHEGLNVQVYNRCIGTRFCQSNCPYKVRRFNLFGYADGQEYAISATRSSRPQNNPDVSVRARGVMEKCTYCVQRISARAAARRARDAAHSRRRSRHRLPGRLPHPRDPASATSPTRIRPSSKLRRDPRHYVLLGDLGTRPRTTYLASFAIRPRAWRRRMSVASAFDPAPRCASSHLRADHDRTITDLVCAPLMRRPEGAGGSPSSSAPPERC